MANPANTTEWIVFFNKDAGRCFFLVDDAEQVQSFVSLDALVIRLRGLGRRFSSEALSTVSGDHPVIAGQGPDR
nr:MULTISPECIES: hypothetical protein [Pseudomonas]